MPIQTRENKLSYLRSRGSPRPNPNLRTSTIAHNARSSPAASGAPTSSHTDATSVDVSTMTGVAVGEGGRGGVGGGRSSEDIVAGGSEASVCDEPAVVLGGAAGAGGAVTSPPSLLVTSKTTARSYDSSVTSLSCSSAPEPVTSTHATRFL